MKVAVVGLGQFGRAVAVRLARAGMEVIAVDQDRDLVDDLKQEVSLAVALDATDEKDLRSQGIDKADVLIAAIGVNFEASVLTALLAKQFGIPRIIGRAMNPMHERILKSIGVTEVVLPEEEAAERVFQRLAFPNLRIYFELMEGFSIAEIDVPADLRGKTLAEADLRRHHGVNLIAIKRTVDGKVSCNAVPSPEERLKEGDVLAVAGEDGAIEKLVSP